MKCALITEEQIKTLEVLLHHGTEWELADVLSETLNSLKVQEPVGFKQSHGNAISWHESGLFPIPVYAGEQP